MKTKIKIGDSTIPNQWYTRKASTSIDDPRLEKIKMFLRSNPTLSKGTAKENDKK